MSAVVTVYGDKWIRRGSSPYKKRVELIYICIELTCGSKKVLREKVFVRAIVASTGAAAATYYLRRPR